MRTQTQIKFLRLSQIKGKMLISMIVIFIVYYLCLLFSEENITWARLFVNFHVRFDMISTNWISLFETHMQYTVFGEIRSYDDIIISLWNIKGCFEMFDNKD